LAWLAGVGLQLQQSQLFAPLVYALGAVTALTVIVVLLVASSRWHLGIVLGAVVALAFTLTGARAGWRLGERLAPALEGADLIVTGVVAEMTQVGLSGTRFIFEVESVRLARPVSALPIDAKRAVPSRLALGWYRNGHDEVELADPRSELRAGQRWRLPLRLRRPHGYANPDGFDSELWLFEQDLRATGYVRVSAKGPSADLLAVGVAHPVERMRQSLRDAILRQVSNARAAGVLAALAVGDQAAIERDDWDLFRDTGVAHLMAISGLHITMFAWLGAALVGRAWRWSRRLMLTVPAALAARWGGLALACFYAIIAGWGVPAQRTLVMLATAAALRSAGLRWPWLLVLVVAAGLVIAYDPWALLQAGFWLSFAAVGLLMMAEPTTPSPGVSGWRGHLKSLFRSQAIATLGLAPLSLVFFQQLSVVGFAANLMAIPFVTLIVTPLALLGAVLTPLWIAAAAAVDALVAVLHVLRSFPWAVWTTAAAPALAVVLGLSGAVIGVLPLPWRLRVLALPLALPLLLPPVERPEPGRFELVAVDIGQGTAVLIRTRDHLLVYDTGPRWSPEIDAGARVVVPLLRTRGEHRVDRLVLSHRDSDHVGGAASLLAALPVGEMLSSLEDGHSLRNDASARAVPQRRCVDGQSWDWDGVHFQILHPLLSDYATAPKANALSCVVRVDDAAGNSALLTGDIEAAQEAALLARHGGEMPATMLIVPHHGSRTSSTAAFIAAVAPEVAVFQAGYRSRFGHPAPDVVERYRNLGVSVVRSDRCGAWVWRESGAHCTRAVHRRYWQWSPADDELGADVAIQRTGAKNR
jgi:competence protein ComEC